MDCVKVGFQENGKNEVCSEKLQNPGKSFFLILVTDSLLEVSNMRDASGMFYNKRATIQTRISFNKDEV